MENAPKIQTAIPKRRYQVGEFGVTVLGEIDSNEPVDYRFIMAFVPEGEQQPVLYVCSEKTLPKDRHEGSHRIRLVNNAMSEIISVSDSWSDLALFSDEALKLGMHVLGLTQERITQLM